MTNDERELLLRVSRALAEAMIWAIGGSDRRNEALSLLELAKKVEQTPFGVRVDTSAMLHAAHDQLHRMVVTFVPGNDGAYTETTDLMRRIREALPGVAFDGGTDGVQPSDGGQPT